MNCAEVQARLVDYLWLELDEPMQQAVENHLSCHCDACNEELGRLREALDLVCQSVPRLPISEEQIDDVLHRIRATTSSSAFSSEFGEHRHSEVARRGTKSLRLQSWLAFAAGIAVMVCIDTLFSVARPQLVDLAKSESATNPASPTVPASLHLSEKRFERMQFVSLHKRPGEQELRGYLLWDALSSEFHLYCFGMRQPLAGKQYALWLIGPTNQLKVVDRLEINPSGLGKAAFNRPVGDFQFVLITLESSARPNDRPSDAIELTSSSIQSLAL